MEALEALAHSPQFQQQLSTFSDALQTGQLDLSQFGLRAAVSERASVGCSYCGRGRGCGLATTVQWRLQCCVRGVLVLAFSG